MSEVVGYLLVFGILSVLMVLSMVAFGVAQGLARERAVELEAESAAARVAGVVVQTALVAEQEGTSVSIDFDIDLPDQLEGADYEVYLEAAGAAGTSRCTDDAFADQVCIVVSELDIAVASPVFAAAAPTNVKICNSDVSGGTVAVRYDDLTDANTIVAAEGPVRITACQGGLSTTKVIFLGEA